MNVNDGGSIERIRDQVSVPDVLALLGMDPPDRSGKINCVYHTDKTPSLHCWEDHWYAYCCGQFGDVIDLYRAVTGDTLRGAVEVLGGNTINDRPARVRRSPITREIIDFTERWHDIPDHLGGGAMRHLIDLRGWPITSNDLRRFGVKADQSHLLIPHHDDRGRVVGVKTRNAFNGKKMAWPGSTFTTRLYRCVERPTASMAVLCEGEPDTWVATKHYHDQRHIAVFGLPSGATAWKTEWSSFLSQFRFVLLIVDEDEAGDRAAANILEQVPRAARQRLPAGDLADAVTAGWSPPQL